MLSTQKNTATKLIGGYRYSFNGKEKIDEVSGSGNSIDFGARIYDCRVGRWLSRDPLERKYANLSAYSYVANSPLMYIDPDGREIKPVDQASNELFYKDLNTFYSGLKFRGKATYKDMETFFGIYSTSNLGTAGNVTGGGASTVVNGPIIRTDLSAKEINQRVRSIKGRENRLAAKAFFQILSSEQIYQVRYLTSSPPIAGSPDKYQPLPEGGGLSQIELERRSAFNSEEQFQDNKVATNNSTNSRILNEPSGISLIKDAANFVPMQGWDFLTANEAQKSSPAKNQGTINLNETVSIIDAAMSMVEQNLVLPDLEPSKNRSKNNEQERR